MQGFAEQQMAWPAGEFGHTAAAGVTELLGGATVLGPAPATGLDTHAMLLRGLPGEALVHLVDAVAMLRDPAAFEKALGMSLRTFQRRRDAPDIPLSPEQSGRVWTFAEILTKAAALLGGQAAAEQWLSRPAMGLEQQRPLDLLSTPAGVELVETFLERLEYGVYV